MCPLRVRVSWPVAASHTFTVSSRLAEASRLPSGLNATLVTRAGVPLEGEDFLAGRGVPHLHRPVPAGGGEPLAVGAERHARDSAGVPLEGDVARGHLSLPVEPLETSAIDAALVGRKLLDEPLLQEFAVIVLPVPLDEIHSDVVQTLLGQLGLGLRPPALLLSVAAGRTPQPAPRGRRARG